jgi:membrane peptidoglycan carboxypeptidase
MTSNGIQHIVHSRQGRREQGKRVTPFGIFLRLSSGAFACGCLALILLVGAVAGSAAGVYSYVTRDLPDPEDIKQVEENFETTIIYDSTGQVALYEVIDPHAGDRSWVSLDEISPYLVCATVALEDKTFFVNPGFDMEGIARAFWTNLRDPSERVQGGSSITQQLIKNVIIPEERRVVSEQGPELDDYVRKGQEVVLAYDITRRYSKDQILEWYLNTNFYGNLAYGIEAAAQVYFGKHAADLTLAEAAMLAPIPQSPGITPLSPDERIREEAQKRQETALDQMITEGCRGVNVEITEQEVEEAQLVELRYRKLEQRFDIKVPHFSTYVLQALEQNKEVYGLTTDMIYRGGLRVYTTIDLDLQRQAECAARVHLALLQGKDYETARAAGGPDCVAADYLYPLPDRDIGVDHQVSNAAVVVLRPRTGEVLAMVGSLDYWDETIDGKFNVAADGLRQPGSSFKPFTYVTLLSNPNYPDDPTLYNAATMFLDVRKAFAQPGQAPYVPENYDREYHGPQRLRLALSRSYNIPAVEAMSLAGIDNVIRTAHAMGIETLDRGLDYYGLSLTLGGGEVHLLDMAYAFSVFANGGYMYGVEKPSSRLRIGFRELDPVVIKRIEDRDGKILWEFNEETLGSREILDPRLAFLMNDILSGRSTRCAAFGCPNALELNTTAGEVRPAAAKTGTTNNYIDGWTVGYTPQIAAGVWVGNSDSSWMKNTPGSKGAAPIWHAVMSYALRDEPVAPFSRPDGLIEMTVCDKSGLLPTPQCPTVTELFIPGTEPTQTDNIYKTFAINKETGKLATVYTPPELVEEKVFEIYPPEAQDWVVEAEIEQPPTEWDTIGPSPTAGDVAIAKPPTYSYINKPTVVEGNAKGGEFERYALAFGKGLNPTAWTQIGGDHYNQVDNGPLEFWDITGLEDGLYSLQLTVVDRNQSFRQATIQVTLDTISPTLDLNYPEDGATYTYGEDEWVTINAEVSDNISMDRVEFFVEGGPPPPEGEPLQPFAVRKVAPFNVRWTIPGLGKYTFYVIAYDAAGNSVTSDKVDITVKGRDG